MTRRVLVVDDSRTQAEALRGLLDAGGYAVTIAASGREALTAARRDPPALVVSDIVLPEMDGYALCRTIKSDDELKSTPVVLVTAFSGPHDIIKALECGADSFVRKPYDTDDLLARLRYLERAEARLRARGAPREAHARDHAPHPSRWLAVPGG